MTRCTLSMANEPCSYSLQGYPARFYDPHKRGDRAVGLRYPPALTSESGINEPKISKKQKSRIKLGKSMPIWDGYPIRFKIKLCYY